MVLNEKHQDALVELIRVGYGRAGSALSEITGKPVQVELPHVAVRSLRELGAALAHAAHAETVVVHESFSGATTGDALLVLHRSHAALLADMLTKDEGQRPRLDDARCQGIAEVGNIVLNTSLSMLGNLLKGNIRFSVPRLHREQFTADALMIRNDSLKYALIVDAEFHIGNDGVGGHFLTLLGLSSLADLIAATQRLAGAPR